MIGSIYPEIFFTLATPKKEELVASRSIHGDRKEAEIFFLDGMTKVMHRLSVQSHPAFPLTIYYAFKQQESKGDNDKASTGWETFLDAVISAGFLITGTLPIRSEGASRMITLGTNALASSIVLVCRRRPKDAPTATTREFLARLKAELPPALMHLQRGNIAPVDLAQAVIGPGMAVYTRYEKVINAEGEKLSVREALVWINRILDEILAEQEGDFDAESRWALIWFEQNGFGEGDYGDAELLSKAKGTSPQGLVGADIIRSAGGKVRLLKPSEFKQESLADSRMTVWKALHHLVQAHQSDGEAAAAEVFNSLGSQVESARELCYRLYSLCERKKRDAEARPYNELVRSWPEIVRLAREKSRVSPDQGSMDLG